ncbi:MAG: hypothetical protein K0R23_3374 [Lacrimispora sp.]|jgi:hypothetical protein|nr:hypothetical protein [Lacrimispora sp.]
MKHINFSSGAPLEELVGYSRMVQTQTVRPLFTMVETPKLNRPSQMVEIELEAFITDEN